MQALVEGRLWSWFEQFFAALAQPVSSAFAAALVPVEQVPENFSAVAINLFFAHSCLVIWLVMVALVYGHDVRDQKELMRIHHRVERFGERYQAIPKFLRDFIEHFIRGYRSRCLPIANGVRLTLNSGLLLIITLILGYRFIEWAAAWLWLGTAHLIGPHSMAGVGGPCQRSKLPVWQSATGFIDGNLCRTPAHLFPRRRPGNCVFDDPKSYGSAILEIERADSLCIPNVGTSSSATSDGTR